MSLSDPIADMLTRLRNAHSADLDHADIPHSKMKAEIARILKQEGFIRDYVSEGGGSKKLLRVYLKYDAKRQSGIEGLKRVSKPSLRKYAGAGELPRVLGGMGIAILSTSSGVMTDREARQQKVGGEVLCYVW